MADEDVRLAHYAAEDAARKAMLRAPSPQPAVAGHEDELVVAHGCVPSPAAAVAMGVTASSGEGHGRWPRPPI